MDSIDWVYIREKAQPHRAFQMIFKDLVCVMPVNPESETVFRDFQAVLNRTIDQVIDLGKYEKVTVREIVMEASEHPDERCRCTSTIRATVLGEKAEEAEIVADVRTHPPTKFDRIGITCYATPVYNSNPDKPYHLNYGTMWRWFINDLPDIPFKGGCVRVEEK